MCARALSHSVTSDSATSWTVACEPVTSCPWGFSRQEYWTGLPCTPPGVHLDSEIELWSLALQADSLPSEPPGKPATCIGNSKSVVAEAVAVHT